MSKLLIYVVSYQRKSYTQGTIELLHQTKPSNSQIIVCDNGSTDGTREWLEENQDKYELGLIFPDKNLRVGGAWTLLTKYFDKNHFDHIFVVDNDGWMLPTEPNWYNQCLELFNSDPKIGSLGLQRERKPGYFSMGKTFDPNYNNKSSFGNFEVYDTVFYAAFRLDKFSLFHETMSNWPHKFIGDKIGRHYNSLGYRTIKLAPGFIVDISEYNFDNKEHREYNIDFYKKERTEEGFKRRLDSHSTSPQERNFVASTFGNNFLNYL